MALLVKLLVVAAVVGYWARLVKNIVKARKIDLPRIVVPVPQATLGWLLIAPPLRKFFAVVSPPWLWRRLAIAIFGWEFHEGVRPFEQFDFARADDSKGEGSSYVLVGLGPLELWTADPKAVVDILQRVRDFEVPTSLEASLAMYGPNVLTSNGDHWSRHRRIVTSVIDERISKAVFHESMRQTRGMIQELHSIAEDHRKLLTDYATAQGKALAGYAATETKALAKLAAAETANLFDMLKRITIHVLIGTSMGKPVSWQESIDEKPEPGYTMTYKKSLTKVVANVIGAVLLPTKFLLQWPSWLWGYDHMTTIGHAKDEVFRRSKLCLDEEREIRAAAKSEAGDDRVAPCVATAITSTQRNINILSKLLQASGDGVKSTMSEGEMISNLFIFTVAGFETTSTALAYAMVLLARYPKWQDWLIEEVDQLLPSASLEDASEDDLPEYNTLFPLCTRTLAFMLETVRLYSPVPHVHRETRDAPQPLRTGDGKTVTLPPHTRVYVNVIALHLLPSWRDVNRASDPEWYSSPASSSDEENKTDDSRGDEYSFRPSRFLNPPTTTTTSESGAATAGVTIYHPPKGTFVPWALGPRICPGQKMAQVEFTAVMLTLLRHHRIEAAPLTEGETRAQMDARLDARLRNSRWVTVLQMNGVFDVADKVKADGTKETVGDGGAALGMRVVRRK